MDSILNQTYTNFKILFIDDASDYTKSQKNYMNKRLKDHLLVFNKERKYSVYNGYYLIHNFAKRKDTVVCVVDGDDWLIDKNALGYIARVYKKTNPMLAYGNCLVWNGKKFTDPGKIFGKHINTRYPKNVEIKKDYRRELFRVLHIQTFKTQAFKEIDRNYFLDEDGNWLKHVLDLAAFTTMLEMTGGNYSVIKRRLYAYNMASKYLNIKVQPIEFVREIFTVSKKAKYGI